MYLAPPDNCYQVDFQAFEVHQAPIKEIQWTIFHHELQIKFIGVAKSLLRLGLVYLNWIQQAT